VTCDNVVESVYVDGVEQTLGGGAGDWAQTSHVTVTAGSQTVAIKCTDEGGIAALLASVRIDDDKEIISDASWSCSNVYEEGWTENDFVEDPVNWKKAIPQKQNGALPWRLRDNISGSAWWIWTDDPKDDNEIFCRKYLKDLFQPLVPGKPNGVLQQHKSSLQAYVFML